MIQRDYNAEIAQNKREKEIFEILSNELLRRARFSNLPPATRFDVIGA